MKRLLFIALMLLAGVAAFGQNSKVENKQKAKYSSIYDLLRQQPGVYVSDSDGKITIRGTGTNSDATQPLMMVDGVRTDNISYLTPDQVWSIEVIKDGSAGFYGGMESANGVIMIVTKGQHEIEAMRAAEEKAAKQAEREARKAAKQQKKQQK